MGGDLQSLFSFLGEFEDEVLKRLQEQGYAALPLPKMEGVPKDILVNLEAQLAELQSEKQKREGDLGRPPQEAHRVYTRFR